MTDTIYIELTVSGTWKISELTAHWSAAEKERLDAGDEEALDALRDAARRATLAKPDDVENEIVEVHT